MARMRKLSSEDQQIMARLIRDIGRKTVAEIVCLWFGNDLTQKERDRIYSYGIGPMRFIRDCLRDYTEGMCWTPLRSRHPPNEIRSAGRCCWVQRNVTCCMIATPELGGRFCVLLNCKGGDSMVKIGTTAPKNGKVTDYDDEILDHYDQSEASYRKLAGLVTAHGWYIVLYQLMSLTCDKPYHTKAGTVRKRATWKVHLENALCECPPNARL